MGEKYGKIDLDAEKVGIVCCAHCILKKTA